MKDKKKIMILGAGVMQVPIITKAKGEGFYTIAIDYDPNAPGFKYADKKYIISTLDEKKVLEVAKDLQIDGILTTSDAPVNTVAYVGEVMQIPSMSMKSAKICTDKWLQRKCFKENGLKTPDFWLIEDIESVENNLDIFHPFPLIVKPVDSSASRGVKKVLNKEELMEAIKVAFSYSRHNKVIVEEYVTGREFSVETFTYDGQTKILSVTEKFLCGQNNGNFVESAHLQPARISQNEYKKITEEVCRAIKAVKLNNSPTHTEIKLDTDGNPCIIEMACRLGGDYITSDLVPLSTGVDMMQSLIKVSVGEKPDLTTKISMNAYVQFIIPSNYEDCKRYIESNKDRIIRYEILPNSHQLVQSSLDRLGYFIIQSDDAQGIYELIKKHNSI